MNDYNNLFLCPISHSQLESNEDLNSLTTADKKKSYRRIKGIPVLLERAEIFFAESYILYGKHLIENEQLINQLDKIDDDSVSRQEYKNNFTKGLRENQRILKDILEQLDDFFCKKNLLQVFLSGRFSSFEYLKAFRYLKRDWSNLPECEVQVNTICNSIKLQMQKINCKGSALFLGAGLGRIAWELESFFQEVLLTDKDFSTAYLYDKIVSGETISFYEMNPANIAFVNDVSNKLSASLANIGYKDVNRIKRKMKYFISDVISLPLKDTSINSIFSIYFTDVLPLEKYFKEVNRVLKSGGFFVHFGPLGYPFSDYSKMLTAEEIKEQFLQNNYDIVSDEYIDAIHLPSAHSLVENNIHNWLFIAQKKTIDLSLSADVNIDSVIGYNHIIKYSTVLQFDNIGELSEEYILHNLLSGRTYEHAENVIDFLRLVDNRSTLKVIIDKFNLIYTSDSGLEERNNKLLDLCRFLLEEKILKIVKR